MAKQRMINTKIWEDAWFNQLDPIEKLFFIYLLTNPMTNIIGVYELSKGTIGRSTGLESRVVDEILSRFEKAGKVFYQEGWVILKNFIKHQNYKSPKIKAGIEAEMANLPQDIRKFVDEGYGIDTLSHTNTNTNSNTNINSNIKAEPPPPVDANQLWDELLNPYREKYAPSLLLDFENYWRAKNINGKKERWQMEKVFDMGRRLDTWKRKDEKWESQRVRKAEPVNETPTREDDHQIVRVETGFGSIGSILNKYGNKTTQN